MDIGTAILGALLVAFFVVGVFCADYMMLEGEGML